MQPLRLLAAVAATSFTFGALLARADDTPAQAAARQALQQQMNQMEPEQPPGSTNSTPPPAAPSAPPATPTVPPVAVQPPPITTPTPQFSTNIPVTPQMESKMAPAGMSQANEPANADTNNRTNLAALTVPPPSALVTNEAEQYPVNPPMAPLPPPSMESSSTEPPATPQLHPVTSSSDSGNNQMTPQPMTPAGNGNGASIQNEPHLTNSVPSDEPIKAPPLPISQEQQAELQNLLQQYMANQITPGQYQQRRAQIIGQQ
jgi:hypothetical protein